jgi:RNA polymerase sigma-70 factor (ECF subfamily)
MDHNEIFYAVQTYSDAVFRVAFSYTRSTADAQDITQETFLALIKHRPVLKDERHLKYWLLKVSANKSKNLLKSAARRRTVPLEAAEQYGLSHDDIGVFEYIACLPDAEKQLVLLHYVEGFTVPEIAELFGKKENAVFKRLSRIRSKLKDMMVLE